MNFLSIADFDRKTLQSVINEAVQVKETPEKYAARMSNKSLLMFFEQPSLRTRLSFEAGMTQMGGHAIHYELGESTIGKKETYKDFACVASRYCDAIMMRIASHEDFLEVARYSSVPVINGMTNLEHPCQVLSDLVTIWEKFRTFKIKLAYFGDGFNNVTHSLLLAAAIVGMDISIASPKGKDYEPDFGVFSRVRETATAPVEITNDIEEAASGADVIYTDSWMSYRIDKSMEAERERIFKSYQINEELVSLAKPEFIFMHCLPAKRGNEVTPGIIDGPNSVVYDQAENRLHAQKALLLYLIK